MTWDCACYCKDTHFEAIHNREMTLSVRRRLCLLLQRYTFWSNSQPIHFAFHFFFDCACYCKDTHFEAIHNKEYVPLSVPVIVLATAKIHILKQFTTLSVWTNLFLLLCLLLQRYTFWSNSQRSTAARKWGVYCACYCKDTHFEAIHNYKSLNSKMVILCLLLQRYTFWSNSQRWPGCSQRRRNCACYCKDTHFEAIHNTLAGMPSVEMIVLATAKIHILKQFTTIDAVLLCIVALCLLLQRYTFWSNSQRLFRWFF